MTQFMNIGDAAGVDDEYARKLREIQGQGGMGGGLPQYQARPVAIMPPAQMFHPTAAVPPPQMAPKKPTDMWGAINGAAGDIAKGYKGFLDKDKQQGLLGDPLGMGLFGGDGGGMGGDFGGLW